MKNTRNGVSAYEEGMQKARVNFAESPLMKELFSSRLDPLFLELFLIHFCSVKTGFVEPVAEYIRQAGDRCQTLGYEELMPFFHHHADEEVGHDKWAIDDTINLVAIWNKRHQPLLNAQELLEQRFTPAVKRYHQLHLDVVRGDAPYGELAIDVEIERISVKFGPKMLFKCLAKLGPRIVVNLSFVRKHVLADQGHDKVNIQTLKQFMERHPESQSSLINIGERAIGAYHGFVSDCCDLAKEKMVLIRSVQSKIPKK